MPRPLPRTLRRRLTHATGLALALGLLLAVEPTQARTAPSDVPAVAVAAGTSQPTATATNRRSPAIARAQQRLRTLGCAPGAVDGRLGQRTRAAVVRLQTSRGLRATGRLTPGTRRALASVADTRRCDRRAVPASSGRGRRIVISQRQNWVWLVGADGRVVAQGGIVDNPAVLRRGVWGTGSRCGRPARVRVNRSSHGTFLLDHFVRFAPCGIGFHRIPRHTGSGRPLHAEYLLGTDLAGSSSGCVRLSAAMARRVWDFTAGPRTTPVHVV